jgi:anaerobic magnesium-protoporphyrin IX monomethyl ester cyclase
VNVTLVNPPFLFPDKSFFVLSQCLGLRHMSSLLKQHGHSVTLVDGLYSGFHNVQPYAQGFRLGLSPEEIVQAIPADSEIVGISSPFSQLAPIAHRLTTLTRARLPNATVVLGGVYPSTQPELAVSSDAHYFIVGEGEAPMTDFVNGVAPSRIEGLYATGQPRPHYATARLVNDLDTLPWPDYEVPQIEGYFKLSQRAVAGKTASIITSRGCPYDCEFCSVHPVVGYRFRTRTAPHVLAELEFLLTRFGINHFEFEDDNFSLQRPRTVEILEGMVRLQERGLRFTWATPNGIRIDTLDDEIVRLFKLSGCRQIVLALEHGDPEMLRLMDKKTDLDEVFEAIRLVVKHQIPKIGLFVLVGYPGETAGRFQNSLKFLRRIKELGGNVSICANIAQPYPGTRLYKQCVAEGLIKDRNFDNFLVRKDLMSTAHTVSVTTPDFNAAEVHRRREAVLNLFRPWGRFAPVRRAVGFLPDPAKEFIKRAILNERQDYAR